MILIKVKIIKKLNQLKFHLICSNSCVEKMLNKIKKECRKLNNIIDSY